MCSTNGGGGGRALLSLGVSRTLPEFIIISCERPSPGPTTPCETTENCGRLRPVVNQPGNDLKLKPASARVNRLFPAREFTLRRVVLVIFLLLLLLLQLFTHHIFFLVTVLLSCYGQHSAA